MAISRGNRRRRAGGANPNRGDCEQDSAEYGHASLWHSVIVNVAREVEPQKPQNNQGRFDHLTDFVGHTAAM